MAQSCTQEHMDSCLKRRAKHSLFMPPHFHSSSSNSSWFLLGLMVHQPLQLSFKPCYCVQLLCNSKHHSDLGRYCLCHHRLRRLGQRTKDKKKDNVPSKSLIYFEGTVNLISASLRNIWFFFKPGLYLLHISVCKSLILTKRRQLLHSCKGYNVILETNCLCGNLYSLKVFETFHAAQVSFLVPAPIAHLV